MFGEVCVSILASSVIDELSYSMINDHESLASISLKKIVQDTQ